MTAIVTPAPKPAWPLLTLAATSFIPGLGFFLGAAAVTWALVSDRPRAMLALGIGAAGAFLNVVGAVAFTVYLRDSPVMREATRTVAQQNLVQLVSALERYRGDHGRYPATLQELVGPVPTTLLNIYDQTAGLGLPKTYQYHLARDKQSYDLFAVGPDGEPGTDDDIHPAPPDSMPDQSGHVEEP